MIEILKATTDHHIAKIESLANEIWREHYTPIIGIDQVVYMLQKFQSTEAIEYQIKTGYEYFLISHNKRAVGYLSLKNENDGVFLSKIYVLANQRGLGIGAETIGFVEKYARKKRKPKIRLTVNKNNLKSKKAYEKLGFVECGTVVADIGHGYVMDDYAMEKTVT
ncbi:MAG: GNAT family N-acetyltransferase [Cyclobacteriaceae bacterium]